MKANKIRKSNRRWEEQEVHQQKKARNRNQSRKNTRKERRKGTMKERMKQLDPEDLEEIDREWRDTKTTGEGESRLEKLLFSA